MPKKGTLAVTSAAVEAAAVIPLLPKISHQAAVTTVAADRIVFQQGDACDCVFYLRDGAVKVHVLSKSGRQAIILIIGPGDFFGESCMLEEAQRVCSVTTMTECTIERIEAQDAWRRLRSDPVFAKKFMDFLVTRNRRYLTDLSDHHFHSTEQRLARVLLRLPNLDGGNAPHARLPRISQEQLAEMVGTTRSRVNFFMNKFRRLGMIEYSAKLDGKLVVHRSLATVLRRD
jgi:CRP-like cAMP-binding protein